jgi:hypothetical protein
MKRPILWVSTESGLLSELRSALGEGVEVTQVPDVFRARKMLCFGHPVVIVDKAVSNGLGLLLAQECGRRKDVVVLVVGMDRAPAEWGRELGHVRAFVPKGQSNSLVRAIKDCARETTRLPVRRAPDPFAQIWSRMPRRPGKPLESVAQFFTSSSGDGMAPRPA